MCIRDRFRDEESFISQSNEDPGVFYRETISPYKGELEAWYFKNKSGLQKQHLNFRKSILERITKLEGVFINSDLNNSLPNTLNFGFAGVSAESLLISLDMDGIAISTGSACSSGAMEASHVLLAMGLSYEQAKASVRVSWGWSTTASEIDFFCNRLKYHVIRLQVKANII